MFLEGKYNFILLEKCVKRKLLNVQNILQKYNIGIFL